MSISIATLGMFQSCCGRNVVGGGAPPYRQNISEMIKPMVLVRNFEMTTKRDIVGEALKNIKVKLIDSK